MSYRHMMKLAFFFGLLGFIVNYCKAQDPASVQIARFKDNKACAISYTFDDGLREHYTQVFPHFNKLKLKATFVINGKLINQDSLKDSTRMRWSELKQMSDSGHEISNHGWAHKNFGKFPLEEIKTDIAKNDSAIFANTGMMPRTFAYPNNTKNPEGVQLAETNRVGTRTFQRSLGSKSNTVELEKWVKKLISDQDWGVTMTHGINYGYDHFASPDVLWNHIQYVKAKEDSIWVGTFREVAAYIKEREGTTLNAKQTGTGRYIITPVCHLDKAIFTEKLTALLKENHVRKAVVVQGKNKLKTVITVSAVCFDFDPFGGDIEVKIQKP